MKKTGLGRGLDELFAENNIDISDEKQITKVRISEVEPNKEQPRKTFEKEKLEELASSIAEHGLLQPVIVRKIGDRYQIISGERRWRASRMAGLIEIPVIVKDIDDKTALEIGLIENLQREDLNAVEEAQGYKALTDEYGLTQEEISRRIGKSRPAIANSMRILSLPKSVLDCVLDGSLTSGHCRALLTLREKIGDEEKFLEAVKQVIAKEMTVRDVENLAKHYGEAPKTPKMGNIYYQEIEEDISRSWGRKIKIKSSGKGEKVHGRIELEYYNRDDLENLIELLKNRGN
ncbi:MAG: ParB/RepB/Spo0J family partition protein [Eubacteriales bacterium]